MSGAGDQTPEQGYTEWRCTNCGNAAPKNSPPCRRCGGMQFEQAEVRASDFDRETRVPSTAAILRENARVAAAAVAVAAVVVVAALASAGVFVVTDPAFGYRYGAVPAESPDDDGRPTAAEFHGRVAADHAETALSWSGRTLQLTFRSDAEAGDALADEVVAVAVTYAAYVERGGDGARLRITARVGDRRARAVVEGEDAAAFARGDITREAYAGRVVG